jgi:hypothetical protein
MKIIFTEIIEIAVPGGYAQQALNLPPQNNLTGVKIVGVTAASLVMGNKSYSGQPLLNAAAFKSAFLVLVNNKSQQFAKIPLNDIESRPEALRRIQELTPSEWNVTKCFIQFGDVGAIASTSETIQLTVHFQ